ncbi:MAG: hypothetical protein GF313_11265 [Caldithrix sp.]|nr:hypothetical protein [Caldithrix sp.]
MIDEKNILRNQKQAFTGPSFSISQLAWKRIAEKFYLVKLKVTSLLKPKSFNVVRISGSGQGACCLAESDSQYAYQKTDGCSYDSNQSANNPLDCNSSKQSNRFLKQLLKETWNALYMILMFLILSFILKAVIVLYIPSEWIVTLLGQGNGYSIFLAAVIGAPMYTSSLAALPLVEGLLLQGMNPAAALAFLIAGPTTTLPAMAAVWGITNKRIFLLYVSFALFGALVMGYVFKLITGV